MPIFEIEYAQNESHCTEVRGEGFFLVEAENWNDAWEMAFIILGSSMEPERYDLADIWITEDPDEFQLDYRTEHIWTKEEAGITGG